MKHLKNLTLFTFMVGFVLFSSSCEDDEPQIEVDNVVGEWTIDTMTWAAGTAGGDTEAEGTLVFEDSGDGMSGTGHRTYTFSTLGNDYNVNEDISWTSSPDTLLVTNSNQQTETWLRQVNQANTQRATFKLNFSGTVVDLDITMVK